jgi:DNA sulfur modification protein DndC
LVGSTALRLEGPNKKLYASDLFWGPNDRGNAIHPVYVPAYHIDGTMEGYLHRFSCRLCIFATEADIQAIYVHDREAFNLVSSLEDRIEFTMRNGKSLFQIIGQRAVAHADASSIAFDFE